jgi:hypothetical protein
MKATADGTEVTKKAYEAPAVRRVNLVVKSAVLSVCHTSPNLTPKNVPIPGPCTVTGCFTTA